MLENEKKLTALNEEELRNVAGGAASLGPSGRPGVSIRTRVCPQCRAICKVRVEPNKVTRCKCSSCGTEF